MGWSAATAGRRRMGGEAVVGWGDEDGRVGGGQRRRRGEATGRGGGELRWVREDEY